MWLCLVLWALLVCDNAIRGGTCAQQEALAAKEGMGIMAFWSKLGMSGPVAAAGGAVVLVLVVGGYVVYSSMPSPETSSPADKLKVAVAEDIVREVKEAPKPVVEVTDPTPTPEDVASALPEILPDVEPEPQEQVAVLEEVTPEPLVEPAPAPAVEPAPTPDRPAFDVVQVQPDGGGVLAGRAVPGRPVIFYLDGAEFARATADRSGKFGLVLDFPASDAPRALSMVSVLEDGEELASAGTLLISPVRLPEPEPEPKAEPEILPDPEPQVEVAAAEEVDAPTEVAEDVAPQIEVPEIVQQEPEPEVQDAPAIVLATDEGVQVLQPAPQPAAPQIDNTPVVANVVIDTITYDTTGDVALAGRGASTGFVRVYLNDKPIKTSQILEDGSWSAPLPDVDAGVYRLRVDEVDTSGAVTSRVETPFQREEPAVVASAPAGPQAVTVQPGFTLWAIARDKFGSGEQYVRVYEANRELIRDPDLIYPGQVFAIPEG